MINVLITAKDSQLAQCLQAISSDYAHINFVFKSSSELDITNSNQVNNVLKDKSFNFCVNCAAYTAVDDAENDSELAYKINVYGVDNLAKACSENNIVLIHVSTDFVFSGNSIKPYSESDKTNPIGVYGSTKLKGEQIISEILTNYYIIRTSWLYSEFGKNFLKTMLRLAKQNSQISIVDDQLGTPTYAIDLAKVIIKLISIKDAPYGLYHFSNAGECSWYDFAKEIFSKTNSDITLNRIKTEDYKTLATRPKYSVLDKSKIKQVLDIEIPKWQNSLTKAISRLKG